MELEIVWRNPLPLGRVEHTVYKVSSDEFGALYCVTVPQLTKEFQLILGAA
ncbi:MAG: hypothetical protein JOY79_07425 [Acidobacteriaceae bacterium]|nr:hypothetical protein [Acidobacteriaceae bacterium]